VGREQGITDEQLADLADFERSSNFGAGEKAVLRYAEGMTRTPAEVSDAAFDDLKRHFDTAQIVELTTMIAFENLRARFNRALHIEADGFCELPADHPVRKAVPPFHSGAMTILLAWAIACAMGILALVLFARGCPWAGGHAESGLAHSTQNDRVQY